jgi:hypothetical protein
MLFSYSNCHSFAHPCFDTDSNFRDNPHSNLYTRANPNSNSNSNSNTNTDSFSYSFGRIHTPSHLYAYAYDHYL